MSDAVLEPRAIGGLLDTEFEFEFEIPSYQRGYRWDDMQVNDLLNDIYEFSQKKERNKNFYCLQPVVVKKVKKENKKKYIVIDGQQRLTTIFLILKAMDERSFPPNKGPFSISYETRKGSEEFLKKINDRENDNKKNNANIDFYFMSKAFETINTWIKNKNKSLFLNTLKKDVKVIWYEVKEDEEEIGIFTRLNIGKIPLKNAELIKAFLLINIKEENDQIKLVSEWDNIESALQNDKMFAFIGGDLDKEDNRIDFIFELCADKLEEIKKKFNKEDKKFSFYVLSDYINKVEEKAKEEKSKEICKEVEEYFRINKVEEKAKEEKSKEIWKEVKEYFRIIEELYSDNTYYHLVGYLTNCGSKEGDIKEIIGLFKEKNKNKFKNELIQNINKINKINKEAFKDLDYNENPKEIQNILFLFNVISTMNGGYMHYPFDIHKQEKWSLEHIHAQNSEGIKEADKRIFSLERYHAHTKENVQELKKMLEKLNKKEEVKEEEFDGLIKKLDKELGQNDIEKHSIKNLALLPQNKNSSLSNDIFPGKRVKILKWDKEGKFIPICTKNIFLKYYTNENKNYLIWDENDGNDYLKEMKICLEKYLGDKNV